MDAVCSKEALFLEMRNSPNVMNMSIKFGARALSTKPVAANKEPTKSDLIIELFFFIKIEILLAYIVCIAQVGTWKINSINIFTCCGD